MVAPVIALYITQSIGNIILPIWMKCINIASLYTYLFSPIINNFSLVFPPCVFRASLESVIIISRYIIILYYYITYIKCYIFTKYNWSLLYLSILLLIVFFIPSCCFKTPSFIILFLFIELPLDIGIGLLVTTFLVSFIWECLNFVFTSEGFWINGPSLSAVEIYWIISFWCTVKSGN